MTARFLVVVGLVLLMLAACGEKEDSDGEPSDRPSTAEDTDDLAGEVSAILPRTEELTGYEKVSSDRLFEPDELADYIGSDAETFAYYGIIKAVAADYRSIDSDLQFVIDAYRFKGVSEAFGMYANERIPEYDFVDIGTQGYLTRGSLVFLKGNYVVRITGYSESPENDSAAVYLGTATANRIPGEAVYPMAIRLLPEEGKLENTERYYPSMFLGHEFFSPAYTCDYQVGDSVSTLAFIPRGSTIELIQYKDSVMSGGNTVLEDEEADLKLFFYDDPTHGRVIMSSRGGRLAGVVNTPDREHGMGLLYRLWMNVDEVE